MQKPESGIATEPERRFFALLAMRGNPEHVGPIEQTSPRLEDPTQVVVVFEHVQVVDVFPQAIRGSLAKHVTFVRVLEHGIHAMRLHDADHKVDHLFSVLLVGVTDTHVVAQRQIQDLHEAEGADQMVARGPFDLHALVAELHADLLFKTAHGLGTASRWPP